MPPSGLDLTQALADRYRIDREIGQGGMATVFLADDLRHDRRVALKVLRPELAAIIGAERFLVEIRTTANLQHPHILPLHDSGEAGGSVYYVMPFVEGQSLRDRLVQEKQLPVDDAVRIAREVASALDYAHRHGVVHRDIKPENILLHDGQALVADFGIALAVSRSDGGTRMTETGMSLGTPHYMAPEQAMGEREISPRVDVYALGCVLYEMLVGEPPFGGPTAQAIIARVVTEQPRGLAVQRRTIPAHVEAAVQTALEKLPADRFATAAAFSEALGNTSYGVGTLRATAVSATAGEAVWNPRAWSLPAKVFAATTVALAATAGWLAGNRAQQPSAPRPVVAFQALDAVPGQSRPVVASTGAIAWVEPDGIRVWLPGATAPIVLPGTERAVVHAFDFSPEGDWLAFIVPPTLSAPGARSALRRIQTSGGVPQTISSEVPGHPGTTVESITWGGDGTIYLSVSDLSQSQSVVAAVPAAGGALDTLFARSAQFVMTNALLPDLRTLLISVTGLQGADARLLALDLRNRDTVSVLLGGLSGHWSPTGHVLAGRHDGALVAVPFDLKSRRVIGAAIPVADSVNAEANRSNFSVGRGGTLAYVRGAAAAVTSGAFRIALVSVAGDIEYLPLPPTDHWDATFSPDGRRIAYTRGDQIWVFDLDLGTHRQLTRDGSNHHSPVWSPDGRQVAFRADRQGAAGQIYVLAADGRDSLPRLLGSARVPLNPTQWLADGTMLAFSESPTYDIFKIRVDSSTVAIPVLDADWNDRNARVSPDGRWIAYASNEDGTLRLYVRRWPELTHKTRVADGTNASSFPLWALDSRTLYVHAQNRLSAVSLDTSEDAIRVTGIRIIREEAPGMIQDLHPDGQRMLYFARQTAESVSTVIPRMIVVTNWFEVLQERLSGAARSRPVP